MDQCLLSIVKEDNPWDVSSLYDFNYYCCPECDSKSQNKQDFINHASNNHPWVSKCCLLGIVENYYSAETVVQFVMFTLCKVARKTHVHTLQRFDEFFKKHHCKV